MWEICFIKPALTFQRRNLVKVYRYTKVSKENKLITIFFFAILGWHTCKYAAGHRDHSIKFARNHLAEVHITLAIRAKHHK